MEAIDMVKSSYVQELLARGLRADSRKVSDFRKMTIVTNVIENAEGSAQVDLGNTRVLAGIKLMQGEPMEDTPNEGTLVMSAELLPLASANYETGPPSPDSIELGRVIDRGIRAGKCVDLESLLIEEGKVWSVYIDIYVLNYDGNLFDAGEAAVMSALLTTKVPAYEDGKVVREKRERELKINNVVTSATFAKIHGSLLLDPDGNEEGAASARLTIATDGKFIRAMQKGLGGSFTQKEVEEMADMALKKHAELKKQIEGSR
jgi:exosome complex component RRP42